jgi:O-antigen ligase
MAVDPPSRYLPPQWFEYLLYFQVFYSIMGTALGIAVNLVGAGMLAFLCALCLIRFGKHVTIILRPIAALLACGMSFLAVQLLVHHEELTGTVREFVPWLLGLVVYQSLALRRGFLHRFSVAAFLVGLATLSFMTTGQDGLRVRLGSGVSISNSNDLAAWFGFCCVYFTIVGLETQRMSVRLVVWLAALGCLGVVGLTVSRGSLLAIAVSLVVASRRMLKRGMFPLLFLLLVAWIAYGIGLFERSAVLYAERGLEETGRFLVWPLAIDRFLQSPVWGVGVSHMETYVPASGASVAPHNSFILLALASGVVPLLFFIGFWLQLLVRALSVDARAHEDAPFRQSLLVYSFLACLDLNAPFMTPWMMATFVSATATSLVPKNARVIGDQMLAGHTEKDRGLRVLAGRSRA